MGAKLFLPVVYSSSDSISVPMPLSPAQSSSSDARDNFAYIDRETLYLGLNNSLCVVCVVITYSRVWINRVRLLILFVVS